MALVEIPVRPSENSYSFRITLDQVTYEMRFTWNRRAEQWSCYLKNRSGEKLLEFPVLGGVDLLGKYRLDTIPQGQLFLYDSTSVDDDPTFESFGDRHKLLYNEAVL